MKIYFPFLSLWLPSLAYKPVDYGWKRFFGRSNVIYTVVLSDNRQWFSFGSLLSIVFTGSFAVFISALSKCTECHAVRRQCSVVENPKDTKSECLSTGSYVELRENFMSPSRGWVCHKFIICKSKYLKQVMKSAKKKMVDFFSSETSHQDTNAGYPVHILMAFFLIIKHFRFHHYYNSTTRIPQKMLGEGIRHWVFL